MKRSISGIGRGALALTLMVTLCSSSLAQDKPGKPAGPAGAPTSGGTAAPGPVGAPSATGGKAITVNVPEAGEHFVRLLPSPDAKQPAQLPVRFLDKKFTLTVDPATLGKSPKMAVDNAATGNTAIIPLPASGTADLHRSDFDHVHRVEVTVTYDNKPVQVAQVTLAADDPKVSPVTKTVDAAARGMVVFEDVPAGKAKLTVVYGDKLTNTQDVVISTDHTGDKQAVQAPVSNKVPTLEVPAAGAAQGGTPAGAGTASGATSTPSSSTPAPSAPQDQGGGIGGLIGQLLGLALIVGAVYALFRWSQTGGMAATLKKVGVEVSGPTPPSDAGTPWQPNAPAAPVVADPSLCQFCGQRKDASGNCLCAITGAGAGAGTGGVSVSGAPVASQPRLVGTVGVYSGSIFPVSANGTPMTFGRDAGNSVSLANDTTVSRRHASIRSEAGGFVVADEGSSNGIYVNGVRVSGAQPLRPGDEVQIGNTRFRFEL